MDQNGSVGLRLLCGGGACNGQPLLFQLLQQSGIFGGGQFVEDVYKRQAFDVVDVADWVAEDDLLASRDADAILDRQ